MKETFKAFHAEKTPTKLTKEALLAALADVNEMRLKMQIIYFKKTAKMKAKGEQHKVLLN